jgi:hypothetical protein
MDLVNNASRMWMNEKIVIPKDQFSMGSGPGCPKSSVVLWIRRIRMFLGLMDSD